jgi:hypothetical protein
VYVLVLVPYTSITHHTENLSSVQIISSTEIWKQSDAMMYEVRILLHSKHFMKEYNRVQYFINAIKVNLLPEAQRTPCPNEWFFKW